MTPDPIYSFKPQFSRTEPTVKPAPTDTINNRSPRFSRLASTASLNASGIVAAVVLPNRSMLMTTYSSGTPSFSAADRMMRRFAWCETSRSIFSALKLLR